RRTIAGRVCMDQVVVDLGDDAAEAGDEVVLFGPGDRGEPTAQDWADATGTISYEIVTRVGPRVPRVYANEGDIA
ncbi:MAG TPA: alanine racemase C-terminal domain-containing protein, partial [Candidatus Eisenbacteria bacterium]|nr:alanine racemase C-terminal domain-containing protein [Candidatus Eisenbacteria bacterium]